jgi:hypothetical protein
MAQVLEEMYPGIKLTWTIFLTGFTVDFEDQSQMLILKKIVS